MQLGRLELMDQSALDHVSKISKIENLDKKHTIVPDEKYKNLSEQSNKMESNEIILDNVKFGFDTETKEFFIRMKNNSGEIQFPTEQIMKMKAHFAQSLEEQIK